MDRHLSGRMSRTEIGRRELWSNWKPHHLIVVLVLFRIYLRIYLEHAYLRQIISEIWPFLYPCCCQSISLNTSYKGVYRLWVQHTLSTVDCIVEYLSKGLLDVRLELIFFRTIRAPATALVHVDCRREGHQADPVRSIVSLHIGGTLTQGETNVTYVRTWAATTKLQLKSIPDTFVQQYFQLRENQSNWNELIGASLE